MMTYLSLDGQGDQARTGDPILCPSLQTFRQIKSVLASGSLESSVTEVTSLLSCSPCESASLHFFSMFPFSTCQVSCLSACICGCWTASCPSCCAFLSQAASEHHLTVCSSTSLIAVSFPTPMAYCPF